MLPFAPKQLEFITKSTKQWNMAHGSVRSGKTVCTLFRFMQACAECPDSQIYMVGHSSDTIYQNAIRLLLESDQLSYFRPFCTWQPGNRRLLFMDKVITILGAKDEGALGSFQGKTFSLVYCDEMTLYPDSIVDMIDTRLSMPYSMGFASMNPSHPEHKLKKWIDKGETGDPSYYSLKFTLDDNPFLSLDYKKRIASSLSGLFYKRYYLGDWCAAEGAIFDFFDKSIHVIPEPPMAADYWICGIDYGTSNPFCALLIGVSTGYYTQTGKLMWVEKEYYWDPKVKGRQKTNSEFAEDLQAFLGDYSLRGIYLDPSAESFQVELRKKGMQVIHADNSVLPGIEHMVNEIKNGRVYICKNCTNLIREIESYSWDPKAAKVGKDAPLKENDHAVDALKYALKSHKVNEFRQSGPTEKDQYFQGRYQITPRFRR